MTDCIQNILPISSQSKLKDKLKYSICTTYFGENKIEMNKKKCPIANKVAEKLWCDVKQHPSNLSVKGSWYTLLRILKLNVKFHINVDADATYM